MILYKLLKQIFYSFTILLNMFSRLNCVFCCNLWFVWVRIFWYEKGLYDILSINKFEEIIEINIIYFNLFLIGIGIYIYTHIWGLIKKCL